MIKSEIESKLISLGFEQKIKDTGINWVTFIACVFSKVMNDKDIGDAAVECYKDMKE